MPAFAGPSVSLDGTDELPVILLERSSRACRSNRYQALLAVELQREQEAEGKTLRGESVTDNSDDDDEFAPAATDAVTEQDLDDEAAHYSDDDGERPYEGDDDDEEAQVQRDERAAKRKKDTSLFYLKKRKPTIRKPMRSTFDVDSEPAGSLAHSTVAAHPAQSSGEETEVNVAEEAKRPQRRRTRGGPTTSASAPPPPPPPDTDMLIRRRAPRTTNSIYRHIGVPSGSDSPLTRIQKPKPKPRAAPAQARLTQEKRLADALEMEEENVDELRTWLEDEEKKRAGRRPAPKVLRGPKLTTLSIEAGRPITVVGGGPDDVECGPSRKKQRRAASVASESASRSPEQEMLLMTDEERSANEQTPRAKKAGSKGKGKTQATAEPHQKDMDDEPIEGPRPTILTDDDGRTARTYLHLSHPPSTSRAEKALLFGDHVDWGQPPPERMSYHSSRSRDCRKGLKPRPAFSAAVQREVCVITGLPTRYKDPKTGKPYATVAAYAEIQQRETAAAATTSQRRPARRSALKSQSPVATTSSSRRRNVRTAPSTDDGGIDDSVIELLAGPPSPVKSVGSAGSRRSHNSNSTGDELVMEAWE